jgi:hypothetical protein
VAANHAFEMSWHLLQRRAAQLVIESAFCCFQQACKADHVLACGGAGAVLELLLLLLLLTTLTWQR